MLKTAGKKLLLLSGIVFMTTLPLTSCWAGDSTLSIAANIVASPCTVSGDSVAKEVDLGQFWTSQLAHAGDTTGWSTFDINLTDCPASTTRIAVTLNGDTDKQAPVYFANSGSGKNVAIEVATKDGVTLSNGSQVEAPVKSNGAIFNLQGRMVSPAGKATSGEVTGTIELTFNYR